MQTDTTLTGNTCSTFPTISIVIGSWGSYNACNERALGSTWLDLADYLDWEEIEEELKKQGFDLNGIDEELFVQDIEGIPTCATNWDYVHPQALFELLQQSGILTDTDKYEKILAYIEVQSFEIWQELVLKNGNAWDNDIYLYPKYDWYDYGKMMFSYSGLELPKFLEMFFDFEGLGEHFKHYDVQEHSNGLIQII